jgi:hypothetical protein
MEIYGYQHHNPVRFCADMLYSGHTFVTCLYGFALIELTRKTFIKCSKGKRIAIQLSVSLFFGLEQLYEVRAILLNRFHYTMDIILAIIMVLLWYTNGAVALVATKWSKLGHPTRQPKPANKFVDRLNPNLRGALKNVIFKEDDAEQFELLERGKAKDTTHLEAARFGLVVVDRPEASQKDKAEMPMANMPLGLQHWAHSWGLGLMPRENFQRRDGDLWVPPACIPFSCCLLGDRHSIISNTLFERYDPHQLHERDPTQWW